MFELKFADIGEGIHEGEILKWHIGVNQVIEEEQVLVEIHTEKVNVEITAPVAGTIISLGKKEGEIINVGEVLVTINDNNGKRKSKSSKVKESKQNIEKDDSLFTPDVPFKRVLPKESKEIKKNHRILAAPAVRRRARESNIDLTFVSGSGPAGRISKQDLEYYIDKIAKKNKLSKNNDKKTLTKKEFISGGEERIPLRGTRRTIARTMQKSKQTAAHFTYMDEFDVTNLDFLRNSAKEMNKDIKITYLPLVVKALIPALKKYPMINASLDDEKEELIVKHYYNIGIAVETEDGLIVPVIKNVDQKSVWEIAVEIKELAEKARSKSLTLNDISNSTFTITSIGNIGGVMATPVIKWPDAGILGIMKKKMKPVAIEKDGKYEIAIKPMMFLSVSADHRIIDGASVARFMNVLISYLENPGLMMLE